MSDPEPTATDERIGTYKKEYVRWLNVLENYHQERFTRNYQQYTAYTSTQGTHAKISDPVAPELVERVIQKMFARDPRFMVTAEGKDLPSEVTDIMEAVGSYFWANPKKVQSSGSLRQKLKVAAREFCVVGNVCVETYYNQASETPDFRIWPIEDIVFNPSMTLKTSPRYYFRQFVSLDYLRSMSAEQDVSGNGKTGLFDPIAVARIAAKYSTGSATMRGDPTPNQVMRSGNTVLNPHVEDILMVTVVERDSLNVCRIVDWTEIVDETEDPLGIGEIAFDFAMDIEVPKQPYAFSLLDFISGVTAAKDLFLNQVVDYGARALNPPLFVDPAAPATNRQTLRNAFKVGGLVFASPASAQHATYPPLPTVGFQLLDYLQQRAEGVSGISPYLGGVPNASNDKTKGTATGVQTLLAASGSAVQDRQQNLEESLIEPIMGKFFKLAGTLMAKNETKYVFLTGQSQSWVEVTKGLLSGKVTLKDLVTAGLVSTVPDSDPTTGQPPPPNPQTGQPVVNPVTTYPIGSPADQLAQKMFLQGKNPRSSVIFDVDWIVRVETGSMAELDAQQDVQNFQQYAQFRIQYRIPTDLAKISHEMGLRMGVKEPDQYDVPQQSPAAGVSAYPFIMPKEIINFADQPPDGKVQMDAKAGINITPQDVAPSAPQPGGLPGNAAFPSHHGGTNY